MNLGNGEFPRGRALSGALEGCYSLRKGCAALSEDEINSGVGLFIARVPCTRDANVNKFESGRNEPPSSNARGTASWRRRFAARPRNTDFFWRDVWRFLQVYNFVLLHSTVREDGLSCWRDDSIFFWICNFKDRWEKTGRKKERVEILLPLR